MKLIKKDWLYDFKSAGYVIGVTLAGISIMFLLVSWMVPGARWGFKEGYEQLYTMVSGIISMYPIWVFSAISPQIKNGKVYLNTTNLPLSKKRLFLKGLKPWLIISPIVIIVGALGNIALSGSAESLKEVFFIITFTPIVILSFGAIIQFQIISGCIFTLTKGIKGYKVTEAIVLFDFILIIICSISIRVLKVDTAHDPWWMTGCGLFILIASLIMFLIAWRDIEKVYQ